MSLSRKVILLLCALFATYVAFDWFVQRQVILPSFEALEADLARTDMDRVRRAIEAELDQFETFCADWGNWLDTYDYMVSKDPSFIDENMTPATLESNELDAVAFVTPDGHFLWRKGLDPATHAEQHWQLLDGDALPADHPFRASIRRGESAKGLVLTEHGPAMLVAAPILDGAGKGPSRGAVLLARIITPEVVARLAEQAQVQLQVTTPTLPTSAGAATSALLESRIEQHPLVNRVFRNLPDIHGQPTLQLRIDVPRAVSAHGRDAVGYAMLSIVIAGIIGLLVVAVLLRRMVLRPVSHLTRHVVEIGEGHDLSRRMNIRRADEIGVLGREFDRMVDQLADARRRLVDQSYEAGAAQVASGVLHNIGNAMTPLAVTVATLQDRLRSAPAGEVDMVVAEIDGGTGDAARRADLEQFLRLASRELTQVIARAGEDADAMARQAAVIQATLAQQLESSRLGPVVETVTLPELLGQAVEMVPPKLRQRLQIELDATLAAAGALPLPRITLQQVVQNLVQNAAEAMRDEGREAGRLRVSCALQPMADNGQRLELRVADDGPGIADEHLPRLFEKGFSTKSRNTNHGIGLHWCANAVIALGGRIRAEQRTGGGATFVIELPLRETGVAAAA